MTSISLTHELNSSNKQASEVLKATNFAEAERLLRNSWSPVVVLDIRLVDDEDDKDLSGLNLAKMAFCRPCAKIILSGRLTPDIARELLRLQATGRLAVEILAKEEGPDRLIEAVNTAFASQVRINWNLAILWNETRPLSFLQLASQITPDLQGDRISTLVDELEQLFRRLFYEKSQITVDSLLWHRQGRLAVTAFAFTPGQPSESLVVICAPANCLQDEYELYGKLLPAAALERDGATVATLKGMADTTHFVAYALAGLPVDDAQTLAEFYHSKPDQKSFRKAITSVWATLMAWQGGKRILVERQASDFQLFCEKTGIHELDRSVLDERLATLQTEAEAHGIKFDVRGQSFRLQLAENHSVSYSNPVNYLYALRQTPASAAFSVIVPGTLSPNSILVAQDGRAWLTDFSGLGPAPVLWSATALEAAVRYDLVESDDLTQLHEMEWRLTEPGPIGRLDSRDVDKPIRQALQSVEAIRRAAQSKICEDTRVFHEGLLLQALGRVAAIRPGAHRARREVILALHAFLAAGMICDRVLAKASPEAHDALNRPLDRCR